jgi:DegV family protein with EDD domain
MIVVVDGAVDLPEALVSSSSVRIVDGEVRCAEAAFNGRREAFWRRLRAGDHFSTAPPSVEALARAYRHDGLVLAVHVSKEMSATVAHAQEAAQLGGTVEVIDSRSLSVGSGLVAQAILEAGASGRREAEMAEWARAFPRRVHTFALIQDIQTLQRSGRAGLLPATHLSKGKPLLLALRGRAVALGQVKDRKHAVQSIGRHASDVALAGRPKWALGHGAASDLGDVTSRLTEGLGSEPSFVTELDPTVGAHLGPDAIVLGVVS